MNSSDHPSMIGSDCTLSIRPASPLLPPTFRFSPRLCLTLLIVLGSLHWCAARSRTDDAGYYLVRYTDKLSDPELDLQQAHEFLTANALLRRRRARIRVDSLDLPVSQNYLTQIRPFITEARYHLRWLNASLVLMDAEDAAYVARFPFVREVKLVGRPEFGTSLLSNLRRRSAAPPDGDVAQPTDDFHGYATPQILELRGDCLHNRGFNGRGRTIAVLDGGFSRLNEIPFFDSLRHHGRILHTADLVDVDSTVDHGSGHGSQVLSVLAAHIPGLMVGSAPGADYLLYRTESRRHQACLEELNWAYAVEQADSLGADIVSSSLGYDFHSGGCSEIGYSNQAARIAVSKGMLVVSSAGNGGASASPQVQRPANEPSVIAVGSIKPDGSVSDFSSFGCPDADAIKPEFVAPGAPAVVASLYEFRVNQANGTSFSAPLVAGFAACLWQAFPTATNRQILEALRRSCPAADQPDARTGYGKPNFGRAFTILEQMIRERRL